MKNIILAAALSMLSISLFAQPEGTFGLTKSINSLYYEYRGEEGVVALRIPGFVMKLAGSFADLEGPERELLRSLRSVTVLTIEENHLYPGVNFTEEVDVSNIRGGYKLLLEVHDEDEDVLIAAREKNGKIRDLIVVVGGDDNVLVHIKGRMESNLLENLSEVAGIDELHFTSDI